MDKETWKPLLRYEGRYEASSRGRIRSVWYRHRGRDYVRKRPRVLKLKEHFGYKVVTLTVDHRSICITVNRLVAIAFHGEPESDSLQAAHRNGVRCDNRPDNLVWATPAENTRQKVVHGMHHDRPSAVRGGIYLYQCKKCKYWFPPQRFHRLYSSKSKCKRESWCKQCRSDYMRARWRQQNGWTDQELAAGRRLPLEGAA